MPGIILTTGLKWSNNHIRYEVNIIDYEAVEDVNNIMLLASGTIKQTDEDQNLFCPIGGQIAQIEIFKNSEVIEFIADLAAEGEGRYYLEILKITGEVSTRLFIGRIIINELEIGDNRGDKIYIEAICGLTLLKSIDFDTFYDDGDNDGTPVVYSFVSLSRVASVHNYIMALLRKIDVVQKFKEDSDTLLHSHVDIELNEIWTTTDDPLRYIAHFDYFTKFKTNPVNNVESIDFLKRTYKNCYEVLEQLLKRYCLRIDIVNDRYVVRSWKSIYENNYTNWHVYRKDNTVVTLGEDQLPISEIDTMVENPMLQAGRTVLTGGLKSVSFKRQKDHIDEENVPKIDIPFDEEVFVGIGLASDQYYLTMRLWQYHQVLRNDRFLVVDIMVKIEVGSSIKYLKFDYDITYIANEAVTIIQPTYTEVSTPTFNYCICNSYAPSPRTTPDIIKIQLPINVDSAFVSVQVNKIGYVDGSGTESTWPGDEGFLTTLEFHNEKYNSEGYEVIKSSNSTKNYNHYSQDILASDTYANYRSKGFIIDPTNDDPYHELKFTQDIKFPLDSNFRIKGQLGFTNADIALLEDMLTIGTPVKYMFFGNIRAKENDIMYMDIIQYKGKDYIIRENTHDFFHNYYSLSLHEIGVTDIIIEESPDIPTPITTPPTNNLSSAGVTTSVVNNVTYQEYFNVTDNYVDVDYVLPVKSGLDRTLAGDQKSIQIWINGLLWYQVYEDSLFTLNNDQFAIVRFSTYFRATFNRTTMRGARIQVRVQNYFEFGTAL